MLLAEAQTWFANRGLPFVWRKDSGADGQPSDAVLRPPAGTEIPLGPLGLAVVVPDMHLGAGNDIFRYDDAAKHEARLIAFLEALVALRDELGAKMIPFDVVQLGDFYDLMRVPGTSATEKRALVDHSYARVIELCRALPMLHCIGNHDKDFWRDPPPSAEANYAIARSIGGPDILCFHGHDKVTLFNVLVHNLPETLLLTTLNAIDSLPPLGYLTSWLQAMGDGTLLDDAFGETQSKPWGKGVPGPDGWSAPWVARDDAADLGTVIRGFEKGLNHVVALAFVGHSHRPGISWSPVTQLRDVPLVDVGSWTYGRAEFALVASDGVGLARLE
jgi:hypothetical protein